MHPNQTQSKAKDFGEDLPSRRTSRMSFDVLILDILLILLILLILSKSLRKMCARSSGDRASASGAESRWFKSSRAYHHFRSPTCPLVSLVASLCLPTGVCNDMEAR